MPGVTDGASDATEAPEDRWNLAYYITLLLGAGTLFPFNTLVAALDYFIDVFPSSHLDFATSQVSSLPSPFIQLSMIKYAGRFSYSGRITSWFLVDSVVLAIIPAIHGMGYRTDLWFTLTGESPRARRASLCASAVRMSARSPTPSHAQPCSCSVVPPRCSSPRSLASPACCPPSTRRPSWRARVSRPRGARPRGLALIQSAGVAGLIVCLLRMMSKVAFLHDPEAKRDSARLYFAISAFVCLLCAVSFRYLWSLPFTQYYLARSPQSRNVGATGCERGAPAPVPPPPSSEGFSPAPRRAEYQRLQESDGAEDAQAPTVREVWSEIWQLGLGVAAVFIMTFLVFPGILINTPSHWMADDWFFLVLVTEFNLFDLIGRTLPSWRIVFTPQNVWIPIALRFILYPLQVFCVRPHIFRNDFFPLLFNGVMALSNGYLASLAMMFGPSIVDAKKKEKAGYIMSFVLNLGILIGSNLALALHAAGAGTS